MALSRDLGDQDEATPFATRRDDTRTEALAIARALIEAMGRG